MSSFAAGKSRLYLSGGFEASQGTAQTLDTSIYVNQCSVNLKEQQAVDDVVTGYLAGISRTRQALSAGGTIAAPCHAAWMGWAMKMLFGASPTSALVSPSTTVYSHTWNAFTTPPATFTLMKQSAKIGTYTETLCGNGVKSIDFKSGKKLVDMSMIVEGLGAGYALGTSEPNVATDTFTNPTTSLPYLIGMTTNLARNGTAITKGFFLADWSLKIEPGYGLIDAAGSLDGSHTRYDVTGMRKVTADFTLLEQSRANLDDFLAQTVNTWSFTIIGPVIDAPNTLNEQLVIMLNRARMVDMWPSEIGSHGVFMIKMKIEALVDTSTGYDVVAVLQDLATSY